MHSAVFFQAKTPVPLTSVVASGTLIHNCMRQLPQNRGVFRSGEEQLCQPPCGVTHSEPLHFIGIPMHPGHTTPRVHRNSHFFICIQYTCNLRHLCCLQGKPHATRVKSCPRGARKNANHIHMNPLPLKMHAAATSAAAAAAAGTGSMLPHAPGKPPASVADRLVPILAAASPHQQQQHAGACCCSCCCRQRQQHHAWSCTLDLVTVNLRSGRCCCRRRDACCCCCCRLQAAPTCPLRQKARFCGCR
jgi:hypothetical protein